MKARASDKVMRGSCAAIVMLVMLVEACPVAAQSFDCAKASSPVETTICASPDLRTADAALARVFARALTNLDAEAAGRLRAEQRAWIAERNACTQDLATIGDCLKRTYIARNTVLSSVAATGPALPPGPAAGSATFARPGVPAGDEQESLLNVQSAGRFALKATSKTGVAIQLVDMIVGPGEIAGNAGTKDGRLDVLLDVGTYKLRTFGAKGATGDAALSVTPFVPQGAADATILRGGEAHGALADLQQRSFWVLVGASKQLTVEAAGRSLRDLRAWQNGVDLVDLEPDVASVEPKAGHPLTRMRLDGQAEPGLYLVTAYGGDPLVWADGDAAQPFHMRVGAPTPLPTGVANATIGPTGTLRFALPSSANYARIDLPEVAPARLTVSRGKESLGTDAIEKASREPAADLRFAAGENAVAEVIGQQGQRVHLRALTLSASARVESAGTYVVGVDIAGNGGDEAPATAVLARFDRGQSKGQVLQSTALRVAPGQAWRRKFNLRGPTTLLVEVAGSGTVAARASGPGVRLGLEPLLGTTAPRSDGKRGWQWDVEAGFYTLRIQPINGAIGVLDLTFGQPDLAVEPTPPAPSRERMDFGLVTLERNASLQVLLNSAPTLVIAPRLRALPADLASGALVVQQAAKPADAQPLPAPPPTLTPPLPPQRGDAAPPTAPKAAAAKPPAPAASAKPTAPANAAAASQIVPRPVATTTIRAGAEAAKPPTPAVKPALANASNVAAKPLPPKPAPVLATPTPAGGSGLSIPIKAPVSGTIAVTDAAGRPLPFTTTAESTVRNVRSATLVIAPADAARTLTIVWTPTIPNEPIPALPRENEGARIVAGTPSFFDLAKDEKKSFALEVFDGGLYRVETLGRLQTAATIGTRFRPKLDDAEDNGAGHNALIQTFLRGGRYRVQVSAQESSGRLGVVAKPATMLDGGALVAEGSVRATLADGAGAAFAIDVAETGDYRLDLYGLDNAFTARLEDAEGWPLAAPGEVTTLRRRFAKGHYRLVVLPPDVGTQVVARLRRVEEPKPTEGHGPHALPFDAKVSAQWREPTKDAPRTPDRWEFDLAGPSRLTLATSDGMTGDLLDASGKTISRLAKGRDFASDLAAGKYAVEVRALGRDDRLDYTLALHADAIQPDRPRFVELPATIPFAIAQDRVVSLTTFGETQLTGVLRNEAGEAVERLAGRTDDWNLALSRALPTGRYTLDLAALATPKASTDDAEKSEDDAVDNADDPPRAKAVGAEDANTSDDADKQQAQGDADADEHAKVEVRIALPVTQPTQNLSLSGAATAKGPDIARFALPAIDAGSLLAIAADSDAEIVLSLERRGASGTQVVGFSRGRDPVVAVPVDAGSQESWEVAVWPVDGGPSRTKIAARAVTMPAGSGERAALAPLASEGPLAKWRAGRLATPGHALLSLPVRVGGLLTGSTAGRSLALRETGLIAPQTDAVWFVAPAVVDAVVTVAETASEFALTLDAGEAAITLAASSGKTRVWRADATDGQPGFVSSRGAGEAKNTAFAVGDAATKVWNAGADAPLALRVKAIDTALRAPLELFVSKSLIIEAKSAQPLRIAAGSKTLSLQLGPGVAAVLSGDGASQAIWAGDVASSREVAGGWTEILLVNTGDALAPASIDVVPSAPVVPLAAGGALKRFFGAAGALSVPVDAKSGDRLVVAGADVTFVSANGRVARGKSLTLAGPGVLTLDHPAGLVVVGLERGDLSPWRTPAPVATPLPKSQPLSGNAMAVSLHADGPLMLRVRTTAPVVLALRQNGLGDPEPMPLGADVRRYVAAGDAELRLFSAHDGPLTGTLDLSAEPVAPVADGLGAPQVIAPGGTALFTFEVQRATTIGVGLRAEPDRVTVRLLDEKGVPLGEGVAQLRKLEQGRYLIEARAPADGSAITVRPAVIGLAPRPSGPPPDVAAKYLELVGMTKAGR